jgi:RNA polymerase sigma-70 factor (ECF subfamily)
LPLDCRCIHVRLSKKSIVVIFMCDTIPSASLIADAELLTQAQRYLTQREKELPPCQDLEGAWIVFYDRTLQKIRKFAFTCGAAAEDIADCVQEVWTELLTRLPTFRLDSKRGQFDSWLFHIVRGKTANLRRSHKRRLLQGNSATLQTALDVHPSPARTLEEKEMFTLACNQLKRNLSECNFQVLQLRLVEDRPVAEVAEQLGLSHEQVWYRYHRARREVAEIASEWSRGQSAPLPQHTDPSREKKEKIQDSAQGNPHSYVSQNVGPKSPARQGGHCVDYVFQRLELGRRELNPEWKVEWNCDGEPRPMLYIRKTAIVAYAELCGPGDYINTHWPRIVNAAIAAGVAAGIATIIATPTAALPIFRTEFQKHLLGNGAGAANEKIQVALSAKQEANGPWCVCKD